MPQYIYYETETYPSAAHGGAAWSASIALTSAANISNNLAGQSSGANLDGSGDSVTLANNDMLQFVLPKGTQVSSSSTITSSGATDAFGTYVILSSPSRNYVFPTIAVIMTDVTDLAAGPEDYTISAIETRDAVYGAVTADYQRAIVAGDEDAACEGFDVDFDWVATAKMYAITRDFTGESISPTDVTKRGPSSNTVPISVKFTTATAIPDNGELVLNLKNGEWEFTAETICSCTALTANAAGTAANIPSPTSGRTLTINSFGAVSSGTAIDISCTYVLVTNSANSTTELVDTLVSLDGASGKQINEWSTTSNTVNVN